MKWGGGLNIGGLFVGVVNGADEEWDFFLSSYFRSTVQRVD